MMTFSNRSRRPGLNARGRSHRMLAGWAMLLLAGWMLSGIVATSAAAQSTTREIKRLLWALEYGADRINDEMTADTSRRVAEFLKARSKGTLSSEVLLSELRTAYAEESEKARSANNQVVDRTPLFPERYGRGRMEIFPDDNLALAGTCPISRVRISDSSPLRAFQACGYEYRVSRPLNLIVSGSRWTGDISGYMLIDLKSGMRVDFLEVPDADRFSVFDLSPDGKEVQVLTTKSEIWRLNIETRQVSRITQFPNSVTNSLRYSPDGKYYAASRSQKVAQKFRNYLALWSRSGDRPIFEAQSEYFIFSGDGRFIAVALDDYVFEIRETATGRVVFRKRINENSPNLNKHGDSAAFTKDSTGLLYLDYSGIAREWNFQTGAVTQKLKPQTEPQRTLFSPLEGKLYTAEGTRIGVYSLDGQSIATVAAPDRIKVTGATMSSDRTLLAIHSEDAIMLVDAQTGQPKNVPSIKLQGITAIAFVPGTSDLVVANSDDEIYKIENGASRRIAKMADSIGSITPARQRQIFAVKAGAKILIMDAEGKTLNQTSVEKYGSGAIGFVDDDRRILFTDKAKEYRAVTFDIATSARAINYEMKSNVRRSGSRTTWMRAWIGFIAPSKADPGLYWVGGASYGSNVLYQYSNGRLSARRGSPEGTTTFFPASASLADTFRDGGLLVVLGKQPKVSSIDGSDYMSQHLQLTDDAVTISATASDRFVTVDKSGEVRIYSRNENEPLLRTILYEDGNWLSRTERGFFAGTKPAAANLFLTQGADGAVSLDSVFDALYRPDLVSEAATGDTAGKVKAAAATLDLEKVLASGPAPKVTIVSPDSDSASPVDEIEVQATIADRGGGVGKVEWRVNGVTLGVEERGLARLAATSASGERPATTIKRKLVLEQGENRVELLAYNGKNLIASEVSQISVRWSGEQTAAPPKLYVLSVGVNDYFDSRLRLAYAVPDATALADGFDKAASGLYAGAEVIKVLDAKVTADNLDKVFTEIGAKVQPRDVFIFFLAGHGKTKNGRYYFLPRDFRYEDETSIEKYGIGQEKFQSWLARVAARKSILLYDTCESGSLTSANARGTNLDERLGALNRMARATGRTFLTATTDDAPAMEGFRGHGVFTYALLDGLNNADVNKNGLIEVSELADYIDQMVPDYSYEAFKLRQIPQRSIVGNNFPIVSRVSLLQNVANVVPAIPTKPTHVIVASAAIDIRGTPAEDGSVIERLRPGTTVTLIESASGWALIAKDGKKLGFVVENSLAELN